jgi:hypothetical protein
LNKLNVEFESEQVSVLVESYARKTQCYCNVAEKIKRDGGKAHYGWAIWQSEYLCEAEHHTVWENDEGDFLDITPRDIEIGSIMFVSDNNLVYRGVSYDNVRINITSNAVVDDLISVCNFIDSMYRLYGERRDDNDEMMYLPEIVVKFISLAQTVKVSLFQFLDNGGKAGSNCFCQSGKKYRTCHGNKVDLALNNIAQKIESDLNSLTR